jgi:hypothetical protein
LGHVLVPKILCGVVRIFRNCCSAAAGGGRSSHLLWISVFSRGRAGGAAGSLGVAEFCPFLLDSGVLLVIYGVSRGSRYSAGF